MLRKGAALYRAGDPFSALHAIRVGSCKTTVLGEQGHEQVAGYHMIGDIVGMDGIASDRYAGQAVALEGLRSVRVALSTAWKSLRVTWYRCSATSTSCSRPKSCADTI